MSIMSDDTATDWDQDDHPDYDLVQDVLLDPDHELANPDSYPRMWNLSAGMAFFEAVIRPDIPERPEFVPIFMPGIASADRDTYGARIFSIARWNSLWEAAQYRRRFFSDDTDPDASDWERLPADLARIAELGDNNIVFIPAPKPATTTTRRFSIYCPVPPSTGSGCRCSMPANGHSGPSSSTPTPTYQRTFISASRTPGELPCGVT